MKISGNGEQNLHIMTMCSFHERTQVCKVRLDITFIVRSDKKQIHMGKLLKWKFCWICFHCRIEGVIGNNLEILLRSLGACFK